MTQNLSHIDLFYLFCQNKSYFCCWRREILRKWANSDLHRVHCCDAMACCGRWKSATYFCWRIDPNDGCGTLPSECFFDTYALVYCENDIIWYCGFWGFVVVRCPTHDSLLLDSAPFFQCQFYYGLSTSTNYSSMLKQFDHNYWLSDVQLSGPLCL